jgi:hydrogenase-4 component F
MLLTLLIAVPAVLAVLALIIRHDKYRRALLPVGGVAHAGMTAAALSGCSQPAWGGWLVLDSLGSIFLGITSLLFLIVSFYGVGYLSRETRGERKDFEEGLIFSNAPEAAFVSCILFFLSAMTLVMLCQNFGLIWVGIEATTLASAPLIYFHRHKRSLEATWKYLLICSVGIAIALMGYLLMAIAATDNSGVSVPLVLGDLLNNAALLRHDWMRAAFIFFLVGYGTKVGLAPLHTWLPDAHSEAPSAVSALLSGALLNCAFLGILRVYQVCVAMGEADFARELLVLFGLLSIAVAAVFILGQKDFKRMLAYSSVEHMGIIALGIGLGGVSTLGALLHAVNHSVTKCALFLVAGNILAAYRTKNTREVAGVLRVIPASGVLWVAGFLAITGTPPFGIFISEFTILKGALDGGQYYIAAAYLALLAIIFIGMASVVLRMAQGQPHEGVKPTRGEPLTAVIPPAVLAVLFTLLGVWIPEPLKVILTDAAKSLGG